MSQSILYNSFDEPKFQDLDNYVKINHDFGSISGRVTYNMEDDKIVEKSIDNSLRRIAFWENSIVFFNL